MQVSLPTVLLFLGDLERALSWSESNVVYGTASSSFSRIRGGSRTRGEKTEDIEPGQAEACPRKAAMTGSLFNIERVSHTRSP